MTNSEALAKIKSIGGATPAQLVLLRRLSGASKKYVIGVLERKHSSFAYVASMELSDFDPAALRVFAGAGFIVRRRRGRKVAFLHLFHSKSVGKKTYMPSRVIGKIAYVSIDAVAKAFKYPAARINALIDRCLALAKNKWHWKPTGLVVRFHNTKGKRRTLGLAWPHKHPNGQRVVSFNTELFKANAKSFESVVLHELSHHYTEETRIGKRPKNGHDLHFCVNYRKVNELVKNQRLCQFYFPHEKIEHLLGKPGMFTRMGPKRRNPSLRLPPPPPGGIEDLVLPDPPKGGVE